MATSSKSRARPGKGLIDRIAKTNGKRAHPIRTQSEAGVDDEQSDLLPAFAHTRHKSTSTSNKLARLSASSTCSPRVPFSPTYSSGGDSPVSPRRSLESYRDRRRSGAGQLGDATVESLEEEPRQELLHFDFAKIDYELDRARKLGSGLWSDVYLCEPITVKADTQNNITSPDTTQKKSLFSSAAVFAVKVPSRRDCVPVLRHEAEVLSHIQSFAGANQYSVPFFGFDPRNSALVLEAVLGGSMDDLINRLKHMTEVTRHQEVVSVFPNMCIDLISGLAFLHDADVTHADIKPMNILLDVSDHYSLLAPIIRARYIDFSSAFIAGEDPPSAAGGTWDFMAPEQIRSRAQPTFASDVWSLGISLLCVILLAAPYKAACGDNAFMLREAIKIGDPLMFARMDLTSKDRMMACQEYIDWCKPALQKDPDKRVTAEGWRKWLEMRIE